MRTPCTLPLDPPLYTHVCYVFVFPWRIANNYVYSSQRVVNNFVHLRGLSFLRVSRDLRPIRGQGAFIIFFSRTILLSMVLKACLYH